MRVFLGTGHHHYLSDGRGSFETGKATPNDLCLFAPQYPPTPPSLFPCSLSPVYFLEAYNFSSPFICQFLPPQSFPLQIYSRIRNEILSHFWLVLNAFIQNEACGNDFYWGSVRAQSLLTCRLYTWFKPLSPTHDMTWPVRRWGKQNEGGKGGYRLNRLIIILEASSRWQKEAGSEAVKTAPAPLCLLRSSIMGHMSPLHLYSQHHCKLWASSKFDECWGIKMKCLQFSPLTGEFASGWVSFRVVIDQRPASEPSHD